MRCRRPLVLTLVLCLSVLSTACASSSKADRTAPPDVAGNASGAPPQEPTAPDPAAADRRLADAPAATTAAGTAHTSFSVEIMLPPGAPGPAGNRPVRFGGDGAIDFARGQAQATLDLTGLLAGREMEGDATFESVIDGDVFYLRSPLLASLVGARTPWVKVDPTAVTSATGIDLGQVSGLGPAGGGAHLAFLGGVVDGSVVELGAADVRGVSTTHYRATVDLRRAVEATGAVIDARQLDRFAAGVGRNLVVDAFLDQEGRLRRLRYDHPAPGATGGPIQQVGVEYFDFGAPVAVDVPTPDQVSDLGTDLGGG